QAPGPVGANAMPNSVGNILQTPRMAFLHANGLIQTRRVGARRALRPGGCCGAAYHAQPNDAVTLEKLKHFVDRICDGYGAASGEQKADRTRVRADILNHQRARVTGVEELVPPIAHKDLAGISL